MTQTTPQITEATRSQAAITALNDAIATAEAMVEGLVIARDATVAAGLGLTSEAFEQATDLAYEATTASNEIGTFANEYADEHAN